MNESGQNSHIKITTGSLLLKNKIYPEQMAAKAFSRYPFSYYTRESTLENIISSGQLWARNMGEMNDMDEAELHAKDKKNVHALCFCNTRTEGIPMWYMYSGKEGDGLSLRFTPVNLLKWMRQIDRVYPVRAGNKPADEHPLIIGKDVELQFGWVFYHGHKGEYFFKNKWYLTEDGSDIGGDCFFVKKYPWHYEREFRVVLINRTKKPVYAMAIPIPPEVMKSAVLIVGPEGDEAQVSASIKESVSRIEKSGLKIRMEIT